VARAAFLKGTVAMQIWDELGTIYTHRGRCERRSICLTLVRAKRRPATINACESMAEWAGNVKDLSRAAVIVDLILHRGQVFYLKVESWQVEGWASDGSL
jgi:hypothetical protein